jgi:hypothetical protein
MFIDLVCGHSYFISTTYVFFIVSKFHMKTLKVSGAHYCALRYTAIFYLENWPGFIYIDVYIDVGFYKYGTQTSMVFLYAC